MVLWLLRWLLFRLIFSSGVVKLTSGDPSWRNLTALNYHYETQPLPHLFSWYAHQLPQQFQKMSVVMMFVLELIVPFLIFAPQHLRRIAAAALIAFQLAIMATGNFAFFNILTIALCVLLLDDQVWCFRSFSDRRSAAKSFDRHSAPWPKWVIAPVASIVVLVTSLIMLELFRLDVDWPRPLRSLHGILAPFSSLNSYGLFAVMTTTRPEIVIEGSRDNVTWQAYEFKYKPGDLGRVPRFVAPYQPRLDWQMWFAALGNYQDHPWFASFCKRLLQGKPEVLSLLAKNPFPDAPPRYLRALLYEYHFTDFSSRAASKHWWRRELEGLYCPVLSLPDQPSG
jgi:hypothetical protein